MTAAGSRRSGAIRARVTVGAALAVLLWSVTGLPQSDAAESQEQPRSERVVVVAEGDTLWDLAVGYAPAGADRHQWASEVAERNGIDPREVRPGDALRLPAD